MSFLWVLTIKLIMASDLKIRFYSNFLLSFWWMQMCLATLRPLNFFKRKKEKKESHSSSGGFQKSKFFKKNTTWYIIGNRGLKIKVECFAKRYRWRFFLKPVGLELFFLNTWNLSLLSFFLFFVLNIQSECSCLIGLSLMDWELNWKIKVLGSVSIFCRWMTECDEKENVLYPSEKLILFLLLFDFWGCFIVLWNEKF